MLNSRSARGMTLIELMVTITLIGLLLLAGLPAFTTMLSNLRVRAVAEGVLGGVQAARTEALKRNLNITFQLDPASGIGGGWQVLLPDAILSADSILHAKSAVEGGAVQVSLSTGTTDIVFNNLGRRITPDATTRILGIDVSNPDIGACETVGGSVRCLRVTVAIGGESRLCDPKRAVGDPQAC
jgi:type IV fimbrial biogenesis protein FimT